MSSRRRRAVAKSPESKGNDGESARKRKQKQCMKYIVSALMTYVTLQFIYVKHFAGIFVPDVDIDPVTGKQRVRRRRERQYQKLNPKEKATAKDAVVEGHLTLIDISVDNEGLLGKIEGKRYKARATFCKIDWTKQQKNPSVVPMFKELRRESEWCEGTKVEADLYDVARQAEKLDATFKNPTKYTGKEDVVLPVKPTGVIFHETRCGSTLTANLLASFSPDHSRVYSENLPPVHALRACENRGCDPDKHKQLIRDVFYLLGRTLRVDRPQYVFYKIPSIGTMDINKFTMAFPETPWVYLYRNSVEIMSSHFSHKKKKERYPVCARNFELPMSQQPRTTQEILKKHGKTMDSIDVTEYCAAHLAGLSLAAIKEHGNTETGKFVNYNQLPDVAWDEILPEHFGVSPISTGMVDNMKEVASVYSKGRGSSANQLWEEDSTQKKQQASPEYFGASPISTGMVDNMKEVAAMYSKGRGQSPNQLWEEDSIQKHDKFTPEAIAVV
eukprot:scaffold18138_cov128-Cylindrotheca_fusiformis.AAC.15